MSDSLKYWEEPNFGEEKEETTENVKNIIDLYDLLKPYEKIQVRKIIKDKDIF